MQRKVEPPIRPDRSDAIQICNLSEIKGPGKHIVRGDTGATYAHPMIIIDTDHVLDKPVFILWIQGPGWIQLRHMSDQLKTWSRLKSLINSLETYKDNHRFGMKNWGYSPPPTDYAQYKKPRVRVTFNKETDAAYPSHKAKPMIVQAGCVWTAELFTQNIQVAIIVPDHLPGKWCRVLLSDVTIEKIQED